MLYTYEELRPQAIDAGIKDSRIHISVWLQTQGYIRLRKQINRIRKTYYLKPL
ncbi:hypothetical protein M2101_002308 [Parabacteroides sp. PM5-20]|nr:hypothetical protein [Parabacteroides sp. PM5-20]